MKVLVSFIIPAYNAERTIVECLKSIDADVQNMQNAAEILVIENGCTDKTCELVEKFSRDSCVLLRLLHSMKGVSNARNVGINAAKGDYVAFIDADDIWLNNSMANVQDDLAKYKPDIITYGFIKGTRYQANDQCQAIIHNYSADRCAESDEQLEQMRAWMISKPTHRMQAWAKVYRREWLIENNLLFDPELRYSEDSEFVLRCLMKAKKIVISDRAVLRYVLSPNSVMHSNDSERTGQYVKSLNCSWKVVKDECEPIHKAFDCYVLAHLNLIFVHDIFEVKTNLTFNRRMQQMHKMLQEDIFQNALKNLDVRDCCSIQLLPELLLKLHLNILVGILCCTRSWQNHAKTKKL